MGKGWNSYFSRISSFALISPWLLPPDLQIKIKTDPWGRFEHSSIAYNLSLLLLPKVSKAPPPCEIYLENNPEDCQVQNHLQGTSSQTEKAQKTSGRAKAIQDPKLRECSGNWEVRKPTRMRFGGVPGWKTLILCRTKIEVCCGGSLPARLFHIWLHTYDGSSTPNVGGVCQGQVHHCLLLALEYHIMSWKWALIKPWSWSGQSRDQSNTLDLSNLSSASSERTAWIMGTFELPVTGEWSIHTNHHGRGGCVADPHGEEGRGKHEAKHQVCWPCSLVWLLQMFLHHPQTT